MHEAPATGEAEARRTQRVVALARALARSLDSQELAAATVEALAELMGGYAAAYLTGRDGRLQLAAVCGGSSAADRRPTRLALRAAGRAEPVVADATDLVELHALGVDADGARGLACGSADGPLGVLVVAAGAGALDDAILLTVGDLFTASLEKARRLAVTFAEARHDALTGLRNHRAFDEHLDESLRSALVLGEDVALALLDLDDFKRVNDTYGHPEGDEVLRDVGRAMLRSLRLDEEVFRVGGEEFAIVIRGVVPAAKQVAERIRITLGRQGRGRPLPTVSAGVAGFPADARTKDELVHKADVALYAAKRAGKNAVVAYQEDLRGSAGRSLATVSRHDLHERMAHESVRAGVLAELSALREIAATLGGEGGTRVLLETCARQLTTMLAATACTISRLDGDTVFEAGYFWPTPYDPLADYAYLVADYPATQAVLETGEPRAVSLADAAPDPSEAFVLRELGMEAVVMLRLEVGSRTWGLVEIYDVRPRRFTEGDVELARLVIAQAAGLLEQLENREGLERLYRETLASLSNALEAKDGRTSDHTQQVAELATQVGARLGLSGEELRLVELGALLHDIGKIRVPDAILRNPGTLTEAEWAVMRTHPVVGEQILAPIASLEPVLPIVRSSHERWDGRGYPDGLAGDAIPLGARIVSACDAYRAMVEERPYRPALTREAALGELRRNAGSQFDPGIVGALLDAVESRSRLPGRRRLHRPAAAG